MSLIAVPMAKVNILFRILICSFVRQRKGKLTTSVCEIGSLKLIWPISAQQYPKYSYEYLNSWLNNQKYFEYSFYYLNNQVTLYILLPRLTCVDCN